MFTAFECFVHFSLLTTDIHTIWIADCTFMLADCTAQSPMPMPMPMPMSMPMPMRQYAMGYYQYVLVCFSVTLKPLHPWLEYYVWHPSILSIGTRNGKSFYRIINYGYRQRQQDKITRQAGRQAGRQPSRPTALD